MHLKILNNPKSSCESSCNGIPNGFVDAPKIPSTDHRLEFMREKSIKMGYRFVGRHSAIKVCNWTRESIRGKNVCYKNKFYGIESNRCVQMTPAMFFCTFNCLHCWRNFDYMLPKKNENWDDPEQIIDGCIDAQIEILQGFFGNSNVDRKKLSSAMKPKHFAISLSGEPTLYPYLPELIDGITGRNMTAFLVSNGTRPDMIESLLEHQPTNLYISFYGTNPEMYKKTAAPMVKDFWQKVLRSLNLLGKFGCNTVVRLTLAKRLNFSDPKGYAEIIEKTGAKFVECKAFMPVGGSRKAMKYEDMPFHEEIKTFAEEFEKHSSYRIINEKKDSRVVLLSREGKRLIGIE